MGSFGISSPLCYRIYLGLALVWQAVLAFAKNIELFVPLSGDDGDADGDVDGDDVDAVIYGVPGFYHILCHVYWVPVPQSCYLVPGCFCSTVT